MKFFRELNAFRDWLMLNPLTTSGVALWYTLMSVNNMAGWSEWFTVPNSTLQQLAKISKQGLADARNELKLKGLIDYKPGNRKQAGSYKMISLVKSFDQSDDQTLDQTLDQSLDQTLDQTADQHLTINRHRKDINKNNNSSRRKQVYDKDSIPFRSASYLLAKIKENKPDFKEPDLQKWADDMRKLMEIDKRDVHEVAKVIDWVAKDDFWSTVILSPANLRKKWDQITLRMMKSVKKIAVGGEDIAINVQHHGYDSREDQPYPSITGGKVGRLNRKSVSMP